MFSLEKTISKCLSIILFLFTAVLFNASPVSSAEVTLSWDPPAANTDGTKLTDLKGFNLYYGTASGNYTNSIDAGNSTAYKVGSLAERTTYYFAVTAYNTSLNESDYSNEVAYYINQSFIAEQTCEGQCGQQSQSGCWCDENCSENGNCCEDYEQICVSKESESTEDNEYRGYYEDGCFGTGADCPSYLGIYADLYQCDLNNANLVIFELNNACLNGAVLTNANLYGTSFVNADLSNADLRGAYMRFTDLSGANLIGANLQGADLDKVIWWNTVCPDGTNSSYNGNTCIGHLE